LDGVRRTEDDEMRQEKEEMDGNMRAAKEMKRTWQFR
jgi:hypothetical protein